MPTPQMNTAMPTANMMAANIRIFDPTRFRGAEARQGHGHRHARRQPYCEAAHAADDEPQPGGEVPTDLKR
jgi:hypothetical protein